MKTTMAINHLSANPQWLYVFNSGRFRKWRPDQVRLLPDRYVSINGNNAVPFEDIGDCLLIDRDVTCEQAFEIWNS